MSTKRRKRRLFGIADLEEAALILTRAAEGRTAMAGGFAMMFYGSPRLTNDIDIVADEPITSFGNDHPLSFGGFSFSVGPVPVDWIVRNDAFEGLYKQALRDAISTEEGYDIVTPEYLVAMKMATTSEKKKHEDDILYLLREPDLVDRNEARDIVRAWLGGQFAVGEFDSLAFEADLLNAREGRHS